MSPLLNTQFEELLRVAHCAWAKIEPLPDGSHLVEIPGHPLPAGWNRDRSTLFFVAPPAFPVSAPDCFWVEPGALRLANGATPQASNDATALPGRPDLRLTWFSWHVQSWSASRDSLATYLRVILDRFEKLQ